MKKIINGIDISTSADSGAHIDIYDESNDYESYFIMDFDHPKYSAKEILATISQDYDITRKSKLIFQKIRKAVDEYYADCNQIHTSNRDAYYGYCMNGGGGRRAYHSMYPNN